MRSNQKCCCCLGLGWVWVYVSEIRFLFGLDCNIAEGFVDFIFISSFLIISSGLLIGAVCLILVTVESFHQGQYLWSRKRPRALLIRGRLLDVRAHNLRRLGIKTYLSEARSVQKIV